MSLLGLLSARGEGRACLPLDSPTFFNPPKQVNRLGDDNAALQERLAEAQGAVAQAAEAVDAADAQGSSGAAELAAARQDKAGVEARCAQLEGELRKSKRREEKLQVGGWAPGSWWMCTWMLACGRLRGMQ